MKSFTDWLNENGLIPNIYVRKAEVGTYCVHFGIYKKEHDSHHLIKFTSSNYEEMSQKLKGFADNIVHNDLFIMAKKQTLAKEAVEFTNLETVFTRDRLVDQIRMQIVGYPEYPLPAVADTLKYILGGYASVKTLLVDKEVRPSPLTVGLPIQDIDNKEIRLTKESKILSDWLEELEKQCPIAKNKNAAMNADLDLL